MQHSVHGQSSQLLIWILTAVRKLYIKSQPMSFIYWLDQRHNVHHSAVRIPGKKVRRLYSVVLISGLPGTQHIPFHPFTVEYYGVLRTWRNFLFFASIKPWVMGEVHGSTTDASRTHFSYSRWVISLDIEKLLLISSVLCALCKVRNAGAQLGHQKELVSLLFLGGWSEIDFSGSVQSPDRSRLHAGLVFMNEYFVWHCIQMKCFCAVVSQVKEQICLIIQIRSTE